MKNILLSFLTLCLLSFSAKSQNGTPVLDDYEFGRATTSDSLVIDENKRLVINGDTMPEGRFKSPVKFTRKELNKIKDPSVQDEFWYAINDTVDQARYYKAHYAFNRFKDNWAFQFGVGPQTVALDGLDDEFKLGPQIEIGFKKDIHPYWSVRGILYASTYKKSVTTVHKSTFTDNWEDVSANSDWTHKLSYTTFTLRVDAMINLLNISAGREMLYNPFELYAHVGPGMAYSAHKLGERAGSCYIPFWSIGATAFANLSSRWSLYVDATVAWQGCDLEGFSEQCSAYKTSLMLGASYKFTKVRHFLRLGYNDTDLRNQIDEAYKTGDKLALYIQDNKPDTITTLPADLIQAAFFQIDRIELAHTYVLNLGFYADIIKAYPYQKFIVRGFADMEVGSAKRNAWLCQKRAEVVADVLTKEYGVNPNQLVVGGGDLNKELPFMRKEGHHRFNRCTIVAPMTKDYQIIKTTDYDDDSELMDGRVKSNVKKTY